MGVGEAGSQVSLTPSHERLPRATASGLSRRQRNAVDSVLDERSVADVNARSSSRMGQLAASMLDRELNQTDRSNGPQRRQRRQRCRCHYRHYRCYRQQQGVGCNTHTHAAILPGSHQAGLGARRSGHAPVALCLRKHLRHDAAPGRGARSSSAGQRTFTPPGGVACCCRVTRRVANVGERCCVFPRRTTKEVAANPAGAPRPRRRRRPSASDAVQVGSFAAARPLRGARRGAYPRPWRAGCSPGEARVPHLPVRRRCGQHLGFHPGPTRTPAPRGDPLTVPGPPRAAEDGRVAVSGAAAGRVSTDGPTVSA